MDWNSITGERREEAGQGQALEQSSAMTPNLQIVIKTKDFQEALAHTQSSVFWLSWGCVEMFNCFRLIEYFLFFQSSDKGDFFPFIWTWELYFYWQEKQDKTSTYKTAE